MGEKRGRGRMRVEKEWEIGRRKLDLAKVIGQVGIWRKTGRKTWRTPNREHSKSSG
jgi:hypothetical protein